MGEMSCPITGMIATGVPLYILNGLQIQALTNRMSAVEDTLQQMQQTQLCQLRVTQRLLKQSRLLRKENMELK